MSTPTDLSDCSTSFQNEFNALAAFTNTNPEDGPIGQFAKDRALEKADKAAVVAECDALAGEFKGNPGELLAILIVKVLGSKSSNTYQMELKVKADAVEVQGDITKLSNNIQNIVNTGAAGNTGVIQVAAETDEMQHLLRTSPQPQTEASEIDKAIGTTSATLMSGNFANMRHDIFWAEDPNASTYNPTQDTTPPNPLDPKSYTYHFDPDDTNSTTYMNSYSEMQANLKIQGNPYGAQDANKILLDNYNQNVSVTQSLGSAANAEIGLITSKIKMITSATSNFAQDLLTGNRTAVKDQIPQ